MNAVFKRIKIEDVLFFDTELVRGQKELDINSKLFELYQKKIRNKETDELPTEEETLKHYNKFGALKLGYNKIVCATVGKVVEGTLYLRSFIGDEDEILKSLYSKFQTAKYLSGFNILYFDLPTARVNSLRYDGVSELIPEVFCDSNKKPWELKSIIDLMDVIKGTHWVNMSLDELCFHLGIESPKADLDGSQVSETYYTEGVDKIEKYCKADVFAVVNAFCRLQGKPLFNKYVDANEVENIPQEKEIPLLEKLYNTKNFTAVKEDLEKLLKKKKPTKKDKEGIFTILRGVYVQTDFINSSQDSKKVIEQKEKEINEFLNSLGK